MSSFIFIHLCTCICICVPCVVFFPLHVSIFFFTCLKINRVFFPPRWGVCFCLSAGVSCLLLPLHVCKRVSATNDVILPEERKSSCHHSNEGYLYQLPGTKPLWSPLLMSFSHETGVCLSCICMHRLSGPAAIWRCVLVRASKCA